MILDLIIIILIIFYFLEMTAALYYLFYDNKSAAITFSILAIISFILITWAAIKPYTYPTTPSRVIYLSFYTDSDVLCMQDEDSYYFMSSNNTLQELPIEDTSLYETPDKLRIEAYEGVKTFGLTTDTKVRYKVYLPVGSFIEGKIIDLTKGEFNYEH